MKQLKWVYEEMKRFVPVIALVIAAVVLGAVNATVFAYRWMQATVTVEGPERASRAACVGFYSSGSEESYGGLPAAGTNYCTDIRHQHHICNTGTTSVSVDYRHNNIQPLRKHKC